MRTRPPVPLNERFLRLMPPKPSSGCWLWIGGTNGRGHPVIKSGGSRGTNLLVRRVAFEFFHGPIPNGHEVLQTCGRRRCMAPGCLKAMPHADLMSAIQKRDGNWQPKGADAPMAKLTERQVLQLRHLAVRGMTARDMSELTGLTADHCRRIVKRQAWAHL